jgi:hypothetical protein
VKIDIVKLKNVKNKRDGAIEAQCPACAAGGGDTKGAHLIVHSDGKFGCVANPQDKVHNKEILNLVGAGQVEAFPSRPVTIRPFKAVPTKVLCIVPRRTLQELEMKRGDNSHGELAG